MLEFVSGWLKEQSSVWRLGLQLGWGCLWSVYVCAVLAGIAGIIFIMGGILMRIMVEDPMRMKEPLNFDYTAKSPVAYVPIQGVSGVPVVDSKEQVEVGKWLMGCEPSHLIISFRRMLSWYWKTTLFVWGWAMTLFTMELLFALLCCKPLIIPRLRLRHDPNSRIRFTEQSTHRKVVKSYAKNMRFSDRSKPSSFTL
ncbi:hypothetical protein HAX54_050224 [Datura stramonium]|uniref:Uncharacterized protein n=1 Tax=Datura stramonium TaxID=4076 RepID=A0ABS8WN79_DATST|nr:hypothetical protein [Datura stramonium]